MLSIVIPSHRRADLLADCLASVTRHAPAGTDILVIDDASPRHRVSTVARSFPGVRVERLDRRGGFCVAANRGFAAAEGEIVELLNDDTIVSPGWAEAALARFSDPRIGAVAPLVLLGTPGQRSARIDSAGDGYDPGGFAFKQGHRRTVTAEFTMGREVFGASGAAAFYRRAAVMQTGLFPEEFGAYFEDVDLAWRLRAAGFGAWYEPGSVVWHRAGASHGRCRRLIEQQSCNEERVYWRNQPDVWGTLPRHAAVLLGKAVRRWSEGTLCPWLAGRMRVLSEAAAIRRHRRNAVRTVR